MIAELLENGNIRTRVSVYDDERGISGDYWVEIPPGDPEYEVLAAWLPEEADEARAREALRRVHKTPQPGNGPRSFAGAARRQR